LFHLRMAGVEHADFVPMTAQHRSQCFYAQRREAHDFDARIAGLGAAQLLRQQPIEILIVYIDQEYFHREWNSCLGSRRTAPSISRSAEDAATCGATSR